MKSAAVEVLAIGARTPIGLTSESSAAAVRAGVTNHSEYPFITARGEPVVVAADSHLQTTIEGRDRLLLLMTSVFDEVMQKLALGEHFKGKYHILLALPEQRPGFSEKDAKWVQEAIRSEIEESGLEIEVDIAGRGHAGTIQAIEQAMQECFVHKDNMYLVIGADSYHSTKTFLWLEQNLQFTQQNIRSGFIPGEGAGCLALASTGLRNTLRLPPLAIVIGIGTAQETKLRDSETGSFGIGMSQAVLCATRELQLPHESLDTLYIDINGERYRSEEWGFTVMRTSPLWKTLDYEAPSSCWGDVGAAFGALASVLAVQAFVRNYSQGEKSLIVAGSESGLRGAMLLQDPQKL